MIYPLQGKGLMTTYWLTEENERIYHGPNNGGVDDRQQVTNATGNDRKEVTNATGITDDVDLKITVTDTSYSVY